MCAYLVYRRIPDGIVPWKKILILKAQARPATTQAWKQPSGACLSTLGPWGPASKTWGRCGALHSSCLLSGLPSTCRALALHLGSRVDSRASSPPLLRLRTSCSRPPTWLNRAVLTSCAMLPAQPCSRQKPSPSPSRRTVRLLSSTTPSPPSALSAATRCLHRRPRRRRTYATSASASTRGQTTSRATSAPTRTPGPTSARGAPRDSTERKSPALAALAALLYSFCSAWGSCASHHRAVRPC